MDKLSNDRLNRTLVAVIAGALLVGAYLSFTANYHTECSQYAGHGDNRECIGDFLTIKGSDIVGALMQLIFAGIAIWYAISKKTKRD